MSSRRPKTPYVPRVYYSTRSLVYATLHDLVVDARCADRDGLADYAAKVRGQIRTIYSRRHTAKVDAYGWPKVTP